MSEYWNTCFLSLLSNSFQSVVSGSEGLRFRRGIEKFEHDFV